MDVEYDEDVNENKFFKAIKQKYDSFGELSTCEGWIVCVPRRGSFDESILTDEDILTGHILVPERNHASSNFRTLNGKNVNLVDKLVTLTDDLTEICSSYLLFEETFYENSSKYRVWCLERPLQVSDLLESENSVSQRSYPIMVTTLKESLSFLEDVTSDKKILADLASLVEAFEYNQLDLERKPIQAQRDSVGCLYDASLDLLFKDERVKHLCTSSEQFTKNLNLSLETYILHSLRGILSRSVSATTAIADANLNKILINWSEFEYNELHVRVDVYDRLRIAAIKLSGLNRFATVLEKTECLKRSVRYLSQGLPSLSSDDLLPALVLLIARAGLSNWIAHLAFLKHFRFSVPFLRSADETSFLITSLEAAIEYIRDSTRVAVENTNAFDSTNVNYRNDQCSQYHRYPYNFQQSQLRCIREREGNPVASRLFDAIRIGNISEIQEILANEDKSCDAIIEANQNGLCHPLCTCKLCEIHRAPDDCLAGTLVRSKDEKGRGMLHIAASYDRGKIISLLLAHDPGMIDLTDDDGRTALHWACAKGHREAIVILLSLNADPRVTDSGKNTPLHLAAEHGHEDCVEALLRLDRDVQQSYLDPSPMNLNGDTPLHRASKWGYRGIVQILLTYGANPTLINKRGETPITMAHSYSLSEILSGYTTGSSISALTFDHSSDRLSMQGSQSSEIGDSEISKMKKSERAMEKLFTAITEGDTCLACYYLGIENRCKKIVERKINTYHHPLCDCERCSVDDDDERVYDEQEGSTMKRSYNGSTETSGGREYGNLGINTRNSVGETALHVASAVGSTDIVRLLLDEGANVNARTEYEQRTPLHLACLCDKVRVVESLLNCATCEVNAKDRNGDTALHFAVKTANPRLVKLLLRYGANTRIKNDRGATPIQQLREELLRNSFSLPLLDISNILKRNCVENAGF